MGTVVQGNVTNPATGNLVFRKIVRVRPLGPKRMYDIEVKDKSHNFVLPNGVITSNSHSVSYVIISYACAYLKHYFPLEWWTGILTNAKKEEIARTFWGFIHDFVQLPSLSNPRSGYEIIDGKIHFPLEMLLGIGEAAQNQLVRYAPYTDLKDFCDKIQYHKDLHGTPETVKEINKKGVEVVRIKKNPGHSAINAGTAYTMILAGAMDAFFPENYTLVEKLAEFEQVYAESQGKKVKPVNPAYLKLTAYQEFVLKKQILPVWGKNLMDVMVDCKHEMVSTTYGTPKFRVGNQWVDMYSLEDFKDLLDQKDVWIPKGGLNVALAGMVIETRNFPYNKDGKQCEACEVNLELQGEIFKFVQWPDRNTGVLDRRFGSKLEKSLVVLILSKWASDRPFAIKDMVLIEPAFELKLKEK